LPYNALESQRLFRQVEHGTHRQVPGGELVDLLYKQLKEADDLIREQDRLLRAGSRDPRFEPAAAPLAFTPARIIPSEGNPLGLTRDGTDSRTLPPAPLTPQRSLATPRGDGFNAFMATGGVEAPPPIPFKDTPNGEAPPQTGVVGPAYQPPPKPAKRGRKIKL
jgi:hypothetical protein